MAKVIVFSALLVLCIVIVSAQRRPCNRQCNNDTKCLRNRQRCCFVDSDRCDTVCTSYCTYPVSGGNLFLTTPRTAPINRPQKPGRCPLLGLQCVAGAPVRHECQTDGQCNGALKCCSDGCRRRCLRGS